MTSVMQVRNFDCLDVAFGGLHMEQVVFVRGSRHRNMC